MRGNIKLIGTGNLKEWRIHTRSTIAEINLLYSRTNKNAYKNISRKQSGRQLKRNTLDDSHQLTYWPALPEAYRCQLIGTYCTVDQKRPAAAEGTSTSIPKPGGSRRELNDRQALQCCCRSQGQFGRFGSQSCCHRVESHVTETNHIAASDIRLALGGVVSRLYFLKNKTNAHERHHVVTINFSSPVHSSVAMKIDNGRCTLTTFKHTSEVTDLCHLRYQHDVVFEKTYPTREEEVGDRSSCVVHTKSCKKRHTI